MSDERFAPPPAPDLPSDIVARPSPVPGAAYQEQHKPPKPGRPRRYRRPRTTPLVVWAFALIGVCAVVFLLAKATRKVVIEPPDLSALTKVIDKPTTWHAVGEGEDSVLIHVNVEPRDARIFVDGQLAASNPVRVPRAPHALTIAISAPGYESQSFERRADQPHTLTVKLKKLKQH